MSVAPAPTLRSSPILCDVPSNGVRRLIDDGTLQYEASTAGLAERYRRGETPQTVHVWWARRPHSAMRSLVFACLSRDCSMDSHSLMNTLSTPSATSPMVLAAARSHLKKNNLGVPRILDCFGGGGTIGFEAASLGVDATSIDSNELAVFIQRSILSYPQRVQPDQLLSLVKQSGRKILQTLTTLTNELFPHRNNTFAYFWTYSAKCDACGYRFYLCKRPWLSRKKKRIALVFEEGRERQRVSISEVNDGHLHKAAWIGRNATFECPKCKQAVVRKRIQECQDELVAVAQYSKNGKRFVANPPGAVPSHAELASREQELLTELSMTLPSSSLPEWSGIVNPSLYGIRTHSDFLNHRQRIVLLSLIQCLSSEFDFLADSVSVDMARAVIGLLSAMIDQVVDWNCRLSMWIPQNEQVGRAFCGPGVAMLWDYAETDPVSRGPSNLWKKLERIVAGTRVICELQASCTIQQACAQALPFESESFDAVITDPPYYDNVYYNALADFFFAWKRPLIAKIDPDLAKSAQTASEHELVASTFRSGNATKAHEDYCREFGRAIGEAERVLRDEGVFSLLYSHSSLQGWEALLKAYRSTALQVTSVQPLSIERKQRPRAVTSQAVNTCIVFVSHKGRREKPVEGIDSLCVRLRTMVEPFRANLAHAGWSERDIAHAVYAQAIGMLANVSSVSGVNSDIEALRKLAEIVKEAFPTFHITARKSL